MFIYFYCFKNNAITGGGKKTHFDKLSDQSYKQLWRLFLIFKSEVPLQRLGFRLRIMGFLSVVNIPTKPLKFYFLNKKKDLAMQSLYLNIEGEDACNGWYFQLFNNSISKTFAKYSCKNIIEIIYC